MRIAVLADVHGNLVALDAVLNRLRADPADLIVNLGDLVSGPFDPRGSADVQMRLQCPTVSGNHERQLLEGGTGASDTFARSLLTDAHLEWIAGLPRSMTLANGQVFACHGSPAGGDLEYLLEDITAGRPALDTEDAVFSRLSGIGSAEVVLCGHTHTPRIVSARGILIVNPGSVGLPAYSDAEPIPHVVEAGSPHARYAILEKSEAGWTAQLHAIPYDFEAAARQAEQAGFPWAAYAVRTGRMPEM